MPRTGNDVELARSVAQRSGASLTHGSWAALSSPLGAGGSGDTIRNSMPTRAASAGGLGRPGGSMRQPRGRYQCCGAGPASWHGFAYGVPVSLIVRLECGLDHEDISGREATQSRTENSTSGSHRATSSRVDWFASQGRDESPEYKGAKGDLRGDFDRFPI